MKNAKPRFVIDPYRFDGSFLTSMSDGIHCDYTHKTLEELRAGEDNPRLVTVSRNTADKMFRIYLKSKCLPFKEITESQYYENMDMLPPVRHTRNFFSSASLLQRPVHILFSCGRTLFHRTALRHHTQKRTGKADGGTLPEPHFQRRCHQKAGLCHYRQNKQAVSSHTLFLH